MNSSALAMERTVRCKWEQGEIALGMNERGYGRSVVLLPALSSISTRREMYPLLERLSAQFRVSTVDWPGFGDRRRLRDDWSPEILSAFLNWFLTEIVPAPHAVVAAGHAATYALYQAAYNPGAIDRLVLIAPTWRGPLPTMTGALRAWFSGVRTAIDTPLVGQLLYRLNVNRFFVGKMAREHVYSDPRWLGGDRLADKLVVTRAPGARHGSVRFVTGALDRVTSRAAFLDLARRAKVRTIVVYGAQTPPKSRAEIDALAEVPGFELKLLPHGKLSIHEEFPDPVADAIISFLLLDSREHPRTD